jgi:hypothetical protein
MDQHLMASLVLAQHVAARRNAASRPVGPVEHLGGLPGDSEGLHARAQSPKTSPKTAASRTTAPTGGFRAAACLTAWRTLLGVLRSRPAYRECRKVARDL